MTADADVAGDAPLAPAAGPSVVAVIAALLARRESLVDQVAAIDAELAAARRVLDGSCGGRAEPPSAPNPRGRTLADVVGPVEVAPAAAPEPASADEEPLARTAVLQAVRDAGGPVTTKALVRRLHRPHNAVYQHLYALERAGVVTRAPTDAQAWVLALRAHDAGVAAIVTQRRCARCRKLFGVTPATGAYCAPCQRRSDEERAERQAAFARTHGPLPAEVSP